jgi:hypothetical protein
MRWPKSGIFGRTYGGSCECFRLQKYASSKYTASSTTSIPYTIGLAIFPQESMPGSCKDVTGWNNRYNELLVTQSSLEIMNRKEQRRHWKKVRLGLELISKRIEVDVDQ